MPNFNGILVFEAERSITKKFNAIWSKAHPLLAALNGRRDRFRKFGGDGAKLILPINFSDQTTNVAEGRADADAFTARTPESTVGFDQAVYEYSFYDDAFYVTFAEKRLIENGRGNFMEGKVNQLMESFKNAVSGDLAGATNAQRANVLGLRYLMSTSNSPGAISQTTYPVWAANVTAWNAPFDWDPIDASLNAVKAKGRSEVDLILASYASTNDVYGKMKKSILPAMRVQSTEDTVKYGVDNFRYEGRTVLMDNHLGSAVAGTIMLLSTDTFYWSGDATPKLVGQGDKRIEGTPSYEFFYGYWACLACDDPACNAYVTGIQ